MHSSVRAGPHTYTHTHFFKSPILGGVVFFLKKYLRDQKINDYMGVHFGNNIVRRLEAFPVSCACLVWESGRMKDSALKETVVEATEMAQQEEALAKQA